MVFCCVTSCKSEWYPGCGITFHKIPKNELQAEVWKKYLPTKGKITKWSSVCNKHFIAADYVNQSKKLISTAVPSIFPKETLKPGKCMDFVSTDATTSLTFPNNDEPRLKLWIKHSESDLQNAFVLSDKPDKVLPVYRDLTKTCRVCLADDVTVHRMSDIVLRAIFESVTNTKLNTDDTKTTSICYICLSQFKKSCRFLEMSQASERLLADLVRGKEINHCETVKIQKMKPNLLVTPVSFVTINEHHSSDKSHGKEELHEDEITHADNEDSLSAPDKIGTSEGSHTPTQQYDMSEIEKIAPELEDQEHIINKCSNPFSSIVSVKERFLKNENPLKVIETVEMSNMFVQNEIEIDGTTIKEEEYQTQDIINDERSSSSLSDSSAMSMKMHEDGGLLKEIETGEMSNMLKQDGIETGEMSNMLKQDGIETGEMSNMLKQDGIETGEMSNILKQDGIETSKMSHMLKRERIEERDGICDVYNKTLVASNYHAHMDVHSKGGFTKNYLMRHMKDHVDRTSHTCQLCSITISDANYRRHMKIHSTETHYACNECTITFNRRDQWESHMSSHTADNSKPYSCNLCERKFKRYCHLNDHMKTHSQTKSFACTECDKTFLRNSNLQSHIATHKGVKMFLCKHCGKSFSRNQHLLSHMNVHTGRKPYACKLCHKRFYRSDHVNRHNIRVHTKSK